MDTPELSPQDEFLRRSIELTRQAYFVEAKAALASYARLPSASSQEVQSQVAHMRWRMGLKSLEASKVEHWLGLQAAQQDATELEWIEVPSVLPNAAANRLNHTWRTWRAEPGLALICTAFAIVFVAFLYRRCCVRSKHRCAHTWILHSRQKTQAAVEAAGVSRIHVKSSCTMSGISPALDGIGQTSSEEAASANSELCAGESGIDFLDVCSESDAESRTISEVSATMAAKLSLAGDVDGGGGDAGGAAQAKEAADVQADQFINKVSATMAAKLYLAGDVDGGGSDAGGAAQAKEAADVHADQFINNVPDASEAARDADREEHEAQQQVVSEEPKCDELWSSSIEELTTADGSEVSYYSDAHSEEMQGTIERTRHATVKFSACKTTFVESIARPGLERDTIGSQIRELAREAFGGDDELTHLKKTDRVAALLLEGEAVAFATYAIRRDLRSLGIGKLAVAETLRQRGLGRILLKHLISMAKQRSRGQVPLEVICLSALPTSISFYRSCGFRESSVKLHASEDVIEGQVYMEYRLQQRRTR